jgi:hypothetical protein
MKVKYFPDTDTAHVEFNDKEVYETKEISGNVYVDLERNCGSSRIKRWLPGRYRFCQTRFSNRLVLTFSCTPAGEFVR